MVYRVFVSSTSQDLADHREAGVAAILGLDGFMPVAMENFGARAAAAVDFDDRNVRESDVLVGLLGLCYGSSPRDGRPSFTEREYDGAIAAEVARLMFVSPDKFPVAGHLIEPDAQRKRQQAFRDRARADQIVEMSNAAFASPAALAAAVTRALANWRAERESADNNTVITNKNNNPHADFLQKLYEVRRFITEDVRKDVERKVVLDWYESEIANERR